MDNMHFTPSAQPPLSPKNKKIILYSIVEVDMYL